MGLRNSPATLQALMSSICRDCSAEFLAVYLDSNLIFSDDREYQLRHLILLLFTGYLSTVD